MLGNHKSLSSILKENVDGGLTIFITLTFQEETVIRSLHSSLNIDGHLS
jgi:hypothetical protein